MSLRRAPLLLVVGLIGCGPVHLLAAANRSTSQFVSYLRSMDRARFRTFLAAVEDGDPIDSALRGAYGMSTDTVWRRFRAGGAARTGQP